MGTLLDKPVTEKETASSSANGFQYGLSAMQGWRVEMEDAHCAVGSIEGLEDHGFFAVFDGHGGSLAAKLSARDMLQKIKSMPEYAQYCSGKADPKLLGVAMRSAFLSVDEDLRKAIWEPSDERERPDHSGCTAIAAIVTPTHIVVANAGDSRSALAVATEAVQVPMSEDHKPYNPAEQRRIHNAGGTVSMKRVDGDLAVSRSLGDFQYKDRPDLKAEEQKVSAEPEMEVYERNPAVDQALIIACDGIWDVMSNEDCCSYVSELIKHTGEAEAGLVCEELIDECLHKGSRDNMSAVIVAFPAAYAGAGSGGVASLRAKRAADEAEAAKRAEEEDAAARPAGRV